MTTDIQITESNVTNVLEEIQQAFFDIPFENSQFQTDTFVVGAQVTPERAYRAIGLRMNSKIQALLEAQYSRAKEDIDIEELEEKIQNPETGKFDRKRAELDIKYKLSNRRYTDKLVNDAITELNVLYRHFKALPKYTREEFEKGEQHHFEIKLTRQLEGIQGAAESLANMQHDTPSLLEFEQERLQLLTKK
jgi:hypothetical protein